ncbi:hypothetical protein ACHAXS_000936 [Conticribra weissflogii]
MSAASTLPPPSSTILTTTYGVSTSVEQSDGTSGLASRLLSGSTSREWGTIFLTSFPCTMGTRRLPISLGRNSMTLGRVVGMTDIWQGLSVEGDVFGRGNGISGLPLSNTRGGGEKK